MIKRILSQHPLFILIIIATFLTASWPFIYYPFTDGDIGNWLWVARETRETTQFLFGPNDQAHGPLLAWMSALFSILSPTSFYPYAVFNIAMTCLAAAAMYGFSFRRTHSIMKAALPATILLGTFIIQYFAHTPMYDWPAAVFLFLFFLCYSEHLHTSKSKWLYSALLCLGLGTLCRFSITLGLAGMFVILAHIILKKSLWQMVKHGILLIITAIGINLPWIIAQTQLHAPFLDTFLYDNIGRFIKSTRPNDSYRAEFYAFPIFTIIGLVPFTSHLVSLLSQKNMFKEIIKNPHYQLIIAMFLPCLLIFSFSGHTKLIRYIAYIFPGLIMLTGHTIAQYWAEQPSIKRFQVIHGVLSGFIGLVLIIYMIQFSSEASSSILFCINLTGLMLGTLIVSYLMFKNRKLPTEHQLKRSIGAFTIIYMVFFSILSFETTKAPFLLEVREKLNRILTH